MKKLLNLTQNEMTDVISESKTPNAFLPKYELMTVHEEIVYKLSKPRPNHWNDTDIYKIIEL